MPKGKTPFIELHDAHVTAALDDRSEQHFRRMMGQDRPEVGDDGENFDEWLKEVCKYEAQERALLLSTSPDVATNQIRLEIVQAYLKKLRAMDPFTFKAQHGTNEPETGVNIAKSRRDRALLRGKRLSKENPEITIDEIINDPLLLQIWPTKDKPSATYLKRMFEGSGITKRGRRKADKNSESR